MKKLFGIYSVIVLLLGSVGFFACSNKKEVESEKRTTETVPDKTAKEVVDRIRIPIEKARSSQKKQEDSVSALEETLKEQ